MTKIIKKYQKVLLAIFGVGLMLTFVVSTGSSYYQSSSNNPVVAHIGDEPVHAQEQMDSRRMWARLRQTSVANLPIARQGQPIPAMYILQEGAPLIDHDQDSFLLLQAEAKKLGLTAPADAVEELMHNQVTLNANSTPEDVQDTRQAFTALLLVKAAYERGLSVVKATQPQQQYDAAMLGQAIKLKYISYDANEFLATVPAPTQDQLKEQFEKYSNFLPDQPKEDTNPFGFGYMYPPRVMVEYLTLRQSDLREAVQKSKDAATWEIEARKQYLRNTADYPTSRPAGMDAAPSTQPTTQASTQATSQPTTRPLAFADYKEQIVSQLIDDAEGKLQADVSQKISSTLQTDWAAYHTAVPPTTQPTTQPTAGPTTPLGVPYGSAEYLPKLALAIQQQFNVLPQVNRFAKDWLTQKDLGGLAGIGSAELQNDDPNSQAEPLTFPAYAIGYLDAFGHKAGARDAGPTLSVLSPSPAMTDFSRNVHYFRIFAADPAHVTTNLAPFSQQLVADYKLAAAEAMAKDQVNKLAALARTNGLDAAAASVGRKVFTSGRIMSRGVTPSPELAVKPESERALVKATFDLLKDGDAIKAGKAIAVIELPRDGKVILATPAEITPLFPADVAYQAESYFSRQTTSELERVFRALWFNAEDIQKRVDYRPEEKKEKPAAN